MSDRRRERLYAVVELLEPYLSTSKAKAFLTIYGMTKELDEFFEDQPQPKRIHKNLEECESCSA